MKIIKTKQKSCKYIMDKDAKLLSVLKDEPILHFYEWQSDSLTYGYFIDISKYIDLKKAKSKGLAFAKRPTGGGIVFHLWDIAFSFLMPSNNKKFFLNPIENYKFVNEITLKAIKEFLDESFLLNKEDNKTDIYTMNFCMAKPTKYDVIYNDKKIAGASQRRKSNGYLHQASICLVRPGFEYLQDVLIQKNVAESIFASSYPIFPSGEIKDKRQLIEKKLLKSFKNSIS